MNMVAVHYCDLHKSKFYKNEKVDPQGNLKVWYSHKLANGAGFCTEKADEVSTSELVPMTQTNSSQKMLMCNAMNNAIALAVNDKIQLDQIGSYYKRILSELNETSLN